MDIHDSEQAVVAHCRFVVVTLLEVSERERRVLSYASSQRQNNTYHGLCYTSHRATSHSSKSSSQSYMTYIFHFLHGYLVFINQC